MECKIYYTRETSKDLLIKTGSDFELLIQFFKITFKWGLLPEYWHYW
jgi:hypothetical protein